MMLWNFLKTSENFKSSAWYYRQYISLWGVWCTLKTSCELNNLIYYIYVWLIRTYTFLSYAKILEDMYDKVDNNFESSVQIP